MISRCCHWTQAESDAFRLRVWGCVLRLLVDGDVIYPSDLSAHPSVVILCGKGITGKREALQLCRNFQQRAAKALGDSHVVVQNVKATEAAVLDSMGHSQEARACLTDACEIAGAPTGGVSALGEEFGALSSSDAEAQGEEAEGEDGDEEPVTEHEEAVLCSLKETVAELLEAEKTRQAAVLISEVQALLFGERPENDPFEC
uniref:Uncharacterized protein n=1 Tax=Chromera velia CCMP2878 TaxID=1169474 RepID=A0A0K6S6V0_9ALVE|eukprot:Cvel_3451.t2-p1 / transcript=Cvel_3451.t2 / gene=Cvel_3451 / organism=Chromera_velia_CCMP2878 / gene_product=hypothetical protein / transcript_product=hypothetical protein / location=Cvel_scaffold139:34271-37851(-) / protein_length=201 / sequence_SO=supercontig / SO=protein_coding / is_pseudo=false